MKFCLQFILYDFIQNFPLAYKGTNELIGANGDGEKVPFGVLFEILMECSTQRLHQFHQN